MFGATTKPSLVLMFFPCGRSIMRYHPKPIRGFLPSYVSVLSVRLSYDGGDRGRSEGRVARIECPFQMDLLEAPVRNQGEQNGLKMMANSWAPVELPCPIAVTLSYHGPTATRGKSASISGPPRLTVQPNFGAKRPKGVS